MNEYMQRSAEFIGIAKHFAWIMKVERNNPEKLQELITEFSEEEKAFSDFCRSYFNSQREAA